MPKRKLHSFDQAHRIAAAAGIAATKPAHLLAQLKEHGIGNLEELAQRVIDNAAAAVQSNAAGAAFDDDVPMICYRFSTFRPVKDIGQIEQELERVALVIQESARENG